MDERRDTLERWLFNFTEPPYDESYDQLAAEYRSNLEELHEAEQGTWTVEELAATPDEIREVVEDRLAWLQSKQ